MADAFTLGVERGSAGAAARQHSRDGHLRGDRRAMLPRARIVQRELFDPYGRSYGLVARAPAGVRLGEVGPRSTLTAYTRWGDTWIARRGGTRRRGCPAR